MRPEQAGRPNRDRRDTASTRNRNLRRRVREAGARRLARPHRPAGRRQDRGNRHRRGADRHRGAARCQSFEGTGSGLDRRGMSGAARSAALYGRRAAMNGSGGRDDQRGSRVGLADVRRLEDVVAELRALDYRYGGGACRVAVESRLPAATALLEGMAKTVVLARLHTVVADLYNLAGWTNFDQDRPVAALDAFARALELAVEAGNDDLQANIRYRVGRLHLHYGAVDSALAEFAQGREAALLAHS